MGTGETVVNCLAGKVAVKTGHARFFLASAGRQARDVAWPTRPWRISCPLGGMRTLQNADLR